MTLVPHHNDILFGRGTAINSHRGNQRFRSMVSEQRPLFAVVKRIIAAEIIGVIRESGGRFLMEDPEGGGRRGGKDGPDGGGSDVDGIHPTILSREWVVVDEDKVMTKVMHRLRDSNRTPGEGEKKQKKEETQRQPDALAEGAASGDAPGYDSDGGDSFFDQLFESDRTGGSGNDAEGSVEFELEDVDDNVAAFLREFSAHHDDDPIEEQQREFTMRQWLEKCKSDGPGGEGSGHANLSARLTVALKLVEILIEAEKDERNGDENPIPLSSFAAGNVLIRVKEVESTLGDGLGTKQTEEAIDHVIIMSLIGDNPEAGGTVERLFALGLVLYELFSGGEGPPAEDGPSSGDAPLFLNSIDLNGDDARSDRPRKKSHRSEDWRSECVSDIRRAGVPYSLCALAGNLLDCGRGDARDDDAYSSFADVRSDLRRMLDDPSRFLDDVGTRPMPRLSIRDELYGREDELRRLADVYREHVAGRCGGAKISGKAGVGKTELAHRVVRPLTGDGRFLVAKFDQNKAANPLAAIGSLFNQLCDLFAQDATCAQLRTADEALDEALGVQAALLAGVVPSLSKLMPSRPSPGYSVNCIDSGLSIRFLFGELLRVISKISEPRRISFLLDDLQYADPVSLLLIGSIISSNEGNKVFFACCYRDDEVNENALFSQFLSSIEAFPSIELKNMTVDGLNELVSDALRVSPRITLPLSSVIHHKAGGGNPLFVRQLIASLEETGHIYVNLSHPRWDWDLDKIRDLEISEDVVALLIEEMHRLHADLQLGLKIASCVGSRAKHAVLDILSRDVGRDLVDVLRQIAKKGFMNHLGDRAEFAFAHDKIQQAAYELMPERERREKHMRFGLAICAHAMESGPENDAALFFMAVDQINRGGPGVAEDEGQRRMLAALNLRAGRRAVEFSDFGSAFEFCERGVSFLGDGNHWITDYRLSLDLFDAASESASVLNNGKAVSRYTQELFSHARCPDDKLNGMQAVTKILVNDWFNRDAVESSFKILTMLGERLPRRLGDAKLDAAMDATNDALDNTTNQTILGMEENPEKKRFVTLMKLYALLGDCFQSFEPSLFGATCHRMIELTLENGLCDVTPIALALYGEFLVSMGKLDLGIRLGGLALILVEKKGFTRCKSHVIATVSQSISWATTPLQSIVDAHLTGHREGQLSGDQLCSQMNFTFSLLTNYSSGQCLSDARNDSRRFALKSLRDNIVVSFDHIALLHVHSCALIEGLQVLDLDSIDDLPGANKILLNERNKGESSLQLNHKFYWLMRAFLFRQLDDVATISNMLLDEKITIYSLVLTGLFFECLICFQLARRANGRCVDSLEWLARGESVLRKMRKWNETCVWTFEHKVLLFEAERKYTLGELDEAESLYARSIRSANEHKFMHEEAIASELAGDFFYETGRPSRARPFFLHSVECYERWGALAVARRVEGSVRDKFGSTELGRTDDSLASALASKVIHSKKRRGQE